MKKSNLIDLVVLISITIGASILSLIFRANFITSTVLFFGIPALYLSIRNPKTIVKSTVFSLILGIIGGIIIDYLATNSGAWIVPITIFPSRLFGIIPGEDIIWGVLLIYYIVMFYEHFLDKGQRNTPKRHFIHFLTLTLIAALLFIFLYLLFPALLKIDYFYIKAGVVLILIPAITFLSYFPKLLAKYLKTAAYFFAQGLLFELTGLQLKQWAFTGSQFIGWIEIGAHRFPIEEFLFWLVLFAIAILSYYEFFDDDRK